MYFNKFKKLDLCFLVTVVFYFSLFSLDTYDENAWGKAFLIMVENRSLFDVELDFPDDSSHRVINPGGQIGKMPLSDFARDTTKTLKGAAVTAELAGPVVPVIGGAAMIGEGVNAGLGNQTAIGDAVQGKNPYDRVNVDSGSAQDMAFKAVGDVSASIVRSMLPIVTDRNSIKSQNGPTIENTAITRKPTLKGKGITYIKGFGKDQVLIMQPMKGVGGVWLAESKFNVPSAMSFNIFFQDSGSVALIFSRAEKLTADLQIIFGADDNTKLKIVLDGKTIAFASSSDSVPVRLTPGRKQDFWVGFTDQNLLLVGVGSLVGQNIVLQTIIPDLGKICSKVGFLSFDSMVAVGSIDILPPLKFIVSSDKNIIVEPTVDYAEVLLPSVSSGSLILHALDKQKSSMDFSLLGVDNHVVSFKSDGKDLTISSYAAENSANIVFQENVQLLDFETYPDLIFTSLGNNLICCQANTDYSKVVLLKIIVHSSLENIKLFMVPKKNFAAYNFFLSSPVRSGLDFNATVGSFRNIGFVGNLHVIRQFEYEFDQKGPAIICSNKITQESVILGQAAQQEAYYSFKATISLDGLVDVSWVLDPVNPKKMGLKALVGAARYLEASLFLVADSDVENAEEIATQTTLTSNTILAAFGGIAVRALAGAGEAAINYGFRDEGEDSSKKDDKKKDASFYVATESFQKKDSIQAVSDQVKINKSLFEGKIAEIMKVNIVARKDYDFVLGTMRSIIDLIIDSYVVTSANKITISKILENLIAFKQNFLSEESIKDSMLQTQILASASLNISLLRLLVQIADNEILMSSEDVSGNLFVSKVAKYLNDLSQEILSTADKQEVVLPRSKRVVYWTGLEVPSAGASVLFSVKGAGSLEVILIDKIKFAELQQRFLIDNEFLYHLCLAKNSQEFSLSMAYNAVAVDSKKVSPGDVSLMNALETKPYWLDVSDSKFSFGYEKLGENQILSLPSEALLKKGNYCLGFKSSLTDVSLTKLALGPSLKNISPELLYFFQSVGGSSIDDNFLLSLKSIKEVQPLSLFFKNAQGLFVSRLMFDKSSEVEINLYNDSFKLNFSLFLKREEKSLKLNLYKNLPKKQLIKKVDIPIEVANMQSVMPFWIEIDKQILSLGVNNFWDSVPSFVQMIPGFYKCDLFVKIRSTEGNIKFQHPVMLDCFRNINYSFLNVMSSGKIKIPASAKELEKSKEKAAKKQITAILENLVKDDPLLNTLDRETKQWYTNLVYDAYQYDDLEFDQLSYDAYVMSGGSDTFASSDVLLRDDLKNDNLANDEKKDLEVTQKKRVQSLAARRMAGLGIQGGIMAVSGEARQLSTVSETLKHSAKKSFGRYSSKEEEEEAAKKATGLGFKREVNRLKRDVGYLSSISKPKKMTDGEQSQFMQKIQSLPSRIIKLMKGRRESGNDTPKKSIKERFSDKVSSAKQSLSDSKEKIKTKIVDAKESIKEKASEKVDSLKQAVSKENIKAKAAKLKGAINKENAKKVALTGVSVIGSMSSDSNTPVELIIAPDIDDGENDDKNKVPKLKDLSVDQAAAMLQ